MKAILYLFLLISTAIYGQKNLKTSYETRMDSISISKLSFHINTPASRMLLKREMMYNGVKLSMSTRLNSSVLNDLIMQSDTYDGIFDNMTESDYMSIFKYDLRAKFYITRDIRFLTRVILMGTQYQQNQYITGFYIKF